MGARMRGVAATAAAAVLGLVLAGCGAGLDAPTSVDRPSVPGVNVSTEDGLLVIRNARVAFQPQGYQAGADAPVEMSLFNESTEPVRLVEAASPAAASVEIDGEAEIGPAGFISVTLLATGLRQELGGADILDLELAFDNGERLAIQITMAPPLEEQPRERMDLSDH